MLLLKVFVSVAEAVTVRWREAEADGDWVGGLTLPVVSVKVRVKVRVGLRVGVRLRV